MPRKTRLELTWIGGEERPRLEPRILLEGPDPGRHARRRSGVVGEGSGGWGQRG